MSPADFEGMLCPSSVQGHFHSSLCSFCHVVSKHLLSPFWALELEQVHLYLCRQRAVPLQLAGRPGGSGVGRAGWWQGEAAQPSRLFCCRAPCRGAQRGQRAGGLRPCHAEKSAVKPGAAMIGVAGGAPLLSATGAGRISEVKPKTNKKSGFQGMSIYTPETAC